MIKNDVISEGCLIRDCGPNLFHSRKASSVLIFSTTFEKFLIQKIQGDIITKILRPSYEVVVIFVRLKKCNLYRQIVEKS
jgi:hypothetical protein